MNRVLLEFDARDGTAAKRGAVHDGGVQLVSARAGEHGALSRVEPGIIFENDNDSLDSIDGGTAGGENVLAGGERPP